MGFIKAEVILSFLGLGVPVDMVSWGTMLAEAQSELVLGNWWQLAAATLFMATFVTAFALLTDALRDAMDPKLRGAWNDALLLISAGPAGRLSHRQGAASCSVPRRCAASASTFPPTRTVALVGESGSGKSVSAMSIVGLLPDNAERARAHPVPGPRPAAGRR